MDFFHFSNLLLTFGFSILFQHLLKVLKSFLIMGENMLKSFLTNVEMMLKSFNHF